MAASVVSSTVTSPFSRTAACAAARNRTSVRAEGRLNLRGVAEGAGAAARFDEVAFGAGSGSKSGSRRIIVLRAAGSGGCAAPMYLRFYAICSNGCPTLAAHLSLRLGWD